MDTLWQFTATDNSVDLLGGIIFALAAYHSIRYLIINNISIQGKILYGIIGSLSTAHVFMVAVQLIYGGPVWFTFRTWDIINYVTAVLFLMITHRIHITERYKKYD